MRNLLRGVTSLLLAACGGSAGHATNGTNTGTTGGSGRNGNGAFSTADMASEGCAAQTFPIAASSISSNVYLVVDRSGSMSDGFGGNTQGTKWDAARGALASLLADSAGKAPWGLSLFPPNPSADVCGKAEVDVALSLGDEATILSKVDAITNQALGNPRGSTPTADALKTVRDSAQLDATDRNNYAVLVTDGLPNCNKASDVTAVITEMYNHSPSVKTFVVGLGDGTASDPDLLDTWAVAGHTDVADPAVKYYQANDATGLGSALSQIIGQTTSCSFGLASPPDDLSLVVGTLDGKARPSDATDGYTYDATSHTVTFHGASCAQITSGQAKHVGVVYGCPAPVVN